MLQTSSARRVLCQLAVALQARSGVVLHQDQLASLQQTQANKC